MDYRDSKKAIIPNDKDRGFLWIMCLQDKYLCGVILGSMEQYYNGIIFHIKEFWVKNEMRGLGIGTQIFTEFERRLKVKGVNEVILFTSKGDYTEHFYHKQNFKSKEGMVFMGKKL